MSVEEPPVVIDGGLKPPLVIPVGKPTSAADAQIYRTRKATQRRDGNGVCSKPTGEYFLCSRTNGDVKVRAGGKYGDCPRRWVWIRVARSVDHRERDCVTVPGTLNVTLPGFCAVDVAGVPPGKTQE